MHPSTEPNKMVLCGAASEEGTEGQGGPVLVLHFPQLLQSGDRNLASRWDGLCATGFFLRLSALHAVIPLAHPTTPPPFKRGSPRVLHKFKRKACGFIPGAEFMMTSMLRGTPASTICLVPPLFPPLSPLQERGQRSGVSGLAWSKLGRSCKRKEEKRNREPLKIQERDSKFPFRRRAELMK